MTPTTAQEPETLTMEDLLREDQNSIRALAHGDIVDGVVVRVDPDEVLVDIGAKSEGIISNRELSARGEQPVTLNSGDQVKVYIIQPEDEHGMGVKFNSLDVEQLLALNEYFASLTATMDIDDA